VNKIKFRECVRKVAKFLFKKLYKVRIYNKEILEKGNYILCSNHSSNLDCIVLGCLMKNDDRIIAKKELFVFGTRNLLDALGAIPVDRKNPRQAFTDLNKAVEPLKEGNSLLMFVQGTRSKYESLKDEVKSGAVYLSFHSKTKLLPVYISENYKLGSEFNVSFGTPIDYPSDKLTKNTRKKYEELIIEGINDCMKNTSDIKKLTKKLNKY